MGTPLHTIRMLRAAIRTAKTVLVQPRFGCTETFIKVTKTEALAFVNALPQRATAEELEMYTGTFGTMDADGTVYMG